MKALVRTLGEEGGIRWNLKGLNDVGTMSICETFHEEKTRGFEFVETVRIVQKPLAYESSNVFTSDGILRNDNSGRI